MNRVSTQRRKIARPGSKDRRGGKITRSLNPEKGKKIANARKWWKINAKDGGSIR